MSVIQGKRTMFGNVTTSHPFVLPSSLYRFAIPAYFIAKNPVITMIKKLQ